MLLIREITKDIKTDVIVEESGIKKYYLSGITMQSNIKNKNNRFYPKEWLQREVNRHIENYVNEKRSYGELDHPDSPKINMKNVSHMFVEIKNAGNDFITKAKVIDTPNGKIVKTFIDEGAKLGISSRALGTLKLEDGINMVQEDLYLITPGDIVSDPSGPNSFVQGIKEGVEYDFIDGKIVEMIKNDIDKKYKKNMSKEEKQRLIRNLFECLMSQIN